MLVAMTTKEKKQNPSILQENVSFQKVQPEQKVQPNLNVHIDQRGWLF